MLESGIGRAHNLHLATLPSFKYPNDISASRRYYREDLIDPLIELRDLGLSVSPTVRASALVRSNPVSPMPPFGAWS